MIHCVTETTVACNVMTSTLAFKILKYSSLTFSHDMFRPPGPSSRDSPDDGPEIKHKVATEGIDLFVVYIYIYIYIYIPISV
jgi:hypothetical protein